jgi:hypothetical protein
MCGNIKDLQDHYRTLRTQESFCQTVEKLEMHPLIFYFLLQVLIKVLLLCETKVGLNFIIDHSNNATTMKPGLPIYE